MTCCKCDNTPIDGDLTETTVDGKDVLYCKYCMNAYENIDASKPCSTQTMINFMHLLERSLLKKDEVEK